MWGSTPNGLFVRPEKVNGLEGLISQVALGDDFIVILDKNNFLYTWGSNNFGQLGLGDFEPQNDACSVDLLSKRKILSIFAGKDFSMIIGGGPEEKGDNPLGESQLNYEKLEGQEEELFIEDDLENYNDSTSNYYLKNSIIEICSKQPQLEQSIPVKEGVYNINEVEALQHENDILRKLVCSYEVCRQDLVKMLGLIAENKPQTMEMISPSAFSK